MRGLILATMLAGMLLAASVGTAFAGHIGDHPPRCVQITTGEGRPEMDRCAGDGVAPPEVSVNGRVVTPQR